MRFFYFILNFIILTSYGQALIEAPSFEDTLHCPTNQDLVNINWYKPTYGSSDSFCPCWTPDSMFILPPHQHKIARDGGCFIGLLLYKSTSSDTREYVETELTRDLIPNTNYCVEMYVTASTNSNFNISNIGIGFRQDSSFQGNNSVLNVDTFYIFQDDIIKDSINWTKLTLEFVAIGNEKYLSIGNFNLDSDLNILDHGSLSSPPYLKDHAYYFFDKITLEECKEPEVEHFQVYPNPSDGQSVHIDKYADTTAYVYLYNSIGQIIGNKRLLSGTYKGEIFSGLSAGIYVLVYETLSGYREEKKLVVMK